MTLEVLARPVAMASVIGPPSSSSSSSSPDFIGVSCVAP